METAIVHLKERIETSYSGYRRLMDFYNECRQYTNATVHVDFYQLEWIDANLSSLFEALLYKLQNQNNLSFSTDFQFLKNKFDVLFRNGFIKTEEKIVDHHNSTVEAKAFNCTDKDGFYDYVTNRLIKHPGMPTFSLEMENKIVDDLIEIFCNTKHHANTTDPFFVAGQYYPKAGVLKFTMVDLGDGFLPRIKRATNNEILTSLDSIQWAVKGNSSKLVIDKTCGGLGISGIYKYCTDNQGVLDIVTGDGYWSSSYQNTIFTDGRALEGHEFGGTVINLTFKQ